MRVSSSTSTFFPDVPPFPPFILACPTLINIRFSAFFAFLQLAGEMDLCIYVRVMQIQFAKCLYFTTSELSGIEMTLLASDIMRFSPDILLQPHRRAVTLLAKNFSSYMYQEETRVITQTEFR